MILAHYSFLWGNASEQSQWERLVANDHASTTGSVNFCTLVTRVRGMRLTQSRSSGPGGSTLLKGSVCNDLSFWNDKTSKAKSGETKRLPDHLKREDIGGGEKKIKNEGGKMTEKLLFSRKNKEKGKKKLFKGTLTSGRKSLTSG